MSCCADSTCARWCWPGSPWGPARWPATWPFTARGALRCVTACLEDSRGDLATISIPVLVIYGDQDRVLPYEATSSRLPALLKNARSTIIAGGPHAIIWTHADEVNRALLDFIGHLSSADPQQSGPENPPPSRSQNGRAG
jgi:pimeloyl-ACP methyl ester carboxylesterase